MRNSRSKLSITAWHDFGRLGRTQWPVRRRKQGVAHGLRPLSWRCVRRACSAALNVVELVAQCGDLVCAEAVDELSKCLGGAWARELCGRTKWHTAAHS